ncbi:hypothetical protein ACA910_013159 [Epithemia clementina (nom. ined.)]
MDATTSDAAPQIREVLSLLNDEKECVSVSRMAARLKISRTEASRLLSNVLKEQTTAQGAAAVEAAYITSKIENQDSKSPQNEGDSVRCTVFSLQTMTEKTATDSTSKGAFLYALCPVQTDNNGEQVQQQSAIATSLPSIHEQTLAVWRDMIRDRDTLQLQECVSNSQDLIRSAFVDEEWQSRWLKYQQPSTDLGSKAISRMSGMQQPRKKTATTAASFFASNNKKNSSTSNDNSQQKPSQSASTGSTSKTNETSTKTAKTTSSSLTSNKAKGSNAFNKKRLVPEEKENKHNPSSIAGNNPKGVGNADDFMGDADDGEDDDDEENDLFAGNKKEQVVVSSSTSPPKSKKPKSHQQQRKDDEDDDNVVMESENLGQDNDDEPMEVVEAPSTTRSSTACQQGEPKRRPRRKKLVPKTTMDASGYLHTEMIEVWEEIPSDEEEEEKTRSTKTKKAAAAAPPSKQQPPKKNIKKGTTTSTKGAKLKQGSLMSYFKK